MIQRVPRRTWRSPGMGTGRPRVLIEDDHPALAISDFSLFEQAGLDVAFCSGPSEDPRVCPLLRGAPCQVLAHAEAVAEQRRGAGGDLPPEGCAPLPYPSSVKGQIDAVWRALADRRR
jgi:hypothetical protein